MHPAMDLFPARPGWEGPETEMIHLKTGEAMSRSDSLVNPGLIQALLRQMSRVEACKRGHLF